MPSPSTPPILEYDPDRDAILYPTGGKAEVNGCTKAVACFFGDVLEHLAGERKLEPAGSLGSEMGRIPVYRTTYTDTPAMAYLAGQGAPFAVQIFEKMIASGVKKFVAVSGCGALTADINPGEILVLESALRDEGTSYHYLPPAREVDASPAAVKAVRQTLDAKSIPYRMAKTWSTDAIFRETPSRRLNRLSDGCQVVEMESAALYAVAQYRQVEIVQIAYAGDLVVPGRWEKRGWDERFEDRLNLFDLAVESLFAL
jgi:uridine phosphorylase